MLTRDAEGRDVASARDEAGGERENARGREGLVEGLRLVLPKVHRVEQGGVLWAKMDPPSSAAVAGRWHWASTTHSSLNRQDLSS